MREGLTWAYCGANEEYVPFDGYVYFVSWGEKDSPVKIGWSVDPERRLQGLQVSFPYELKILGVIPGIKALEKEIHGKFRREHLRGEWFSPSGALSQLIEESDKEWRTVNEMARVKLRIRRWEQSLAQVKYQVVQEDNQSVIYQSKDREAAERVVSALTGRRRWEVTAGQKKLKEMGLA